MSDYKRYFGRDPVKVTPLQVEVSKPYDDYQFVEAHKRFKSIVQRERIVGQVKERLYYEKPSEKKRRKRREARERRRIMDMRERMIQSGEWDRRQKKRQQKKQRRIDERLRRQHELGDTNDSTE
jgi:small subunit ribosomal protein S21